MAQPAITELFAGKINQREYVQVVGKETVPSYYQDGVPQGWRTIVYTAKVTETRYRFEGLNYAQAHRTTPVTATDPSGGEYTIPMQSTITLAGTAAFPTYTVEIDRGHMSPHMWWLEVMVRTAVVSS